MGGSLLHFRSLLEVSQRWLSPTIVLQCISDEPPSLSSLRPRPMITVGHSDSRPYPSLFLMTVSLPRAFCTSDLHWSFWEVLSPHSLNTYSISQPRRVVKTFLFRFIGYSSNRIQTLDWCTDPNPIWNQLGFRVLIDSGGFLSPPNITIIS